MSNEELALLIQSGKTEYIETLWLQVKSFIAKQAKQFLNNFSDDKEQYLDDLINQSYFELIKAIDDYNPEKGSFINYLSYHLKNSFYIALFGSRTVRGIKDPVNSAISIDTPINENEADGTISDLLIDKNSDAYMRLIEETDFWDKVGVFIKKTINALPDDDSRILLSTMYDNDCNCAAACRLLGWNVSKGRNALEKGRKKLQIYLNRRDIKAEVRGLALDDFISVVGASLLSYKHSNTSVVERSVLKRDEQIKKYRLDKLFKF